MREIWLSHQRTPVRPPRQTFGVEVGMGAIFLGGKLPGSVAFCNPRFCGGKSCYISDEQRDKEQERAREKRRRNLRNLSEESFEMS